MCEYLVTYPKMVEMVGSVPYYYFKEIAPKLVAYSSKLLGWVKFGLSFDLGFKPWGFFSWPNRKSQSCSLQNQLHMFLSQGMVKETTDRLSLYWYMSTAMRILERLGIQTSSSFVKIWYVRICEFKANFLFFLAFIWLVFFI